MLTLKLAMYVSMLRDGCRSMTELGAGLPFSSASWRLSGALLDIRQCNLPERRSMAQYQTASTADLTETENLSCCQVQCPLLRHGQLPVLYP